MKRAALLLVLLAGCDTRGTALRDIHLHPLPSCHDTPFRPSDKRQLDLLFVIDDSASMALRQQALAAGFRHLVASLETLPDGLPDMHVGVLTSDMGAGGYDVQGCGRGNGGALNDFNRVAGGPVDYLVVDHGEANFDGTMADAFQRMIPLPTNGCGFEQPLAAMTRALTGNLNPGFLRENAVLAVIFVSDEDDCSIYPGSTLFEPETGRWGPLDDYRCFAQGVICQGAPGGPMTHCVPSEVSSQIVPVDVYEDFLLGLKGYDRSKLVVATITGPTDPVVVSSTPELLPSCRTAAGTATPAIRLVNLARRFGDVSNVQSICNDDLDPMLRSIGDSIANGVRGCMGTPTPQ